MSPGTTAPSGTAVIIGNFIRDAGINVLQPGLAAGIFLGCQGRGDIVAHNIIENMPVTGFTIAAGISLLPGNSGATAANSTLIEGNTIIDSAAHGVYVGSNAQNARVVNNSIRGCTESFIAWVPDAAFTGGGYMEFIGNRCSGATKVVQGIYISPTLATGVIGVIDENTINGFNNTTATDTNAGIVIRNFAVNWTVSRNKVNNYYAGAGADVYCNVRCAIQFRDNIFSSCNSGYQLGSSAPVGNVISQNDRLVSTSALQASNVLAGSRCVWPGVYHASTGQFEVRHNAAMTAGIWVVGDRVQQSVSASGSPKGWMCTVAGNPGTWVSEGNL